MSERIARIKKLADIPGVSGAEDAVRQEIITQIQDHCERLGTDPLGNLIAFKKGIKTPVNQIMLAAHMDEVGFIITHIEESGMLRFAPVGGIDSRVMFGKGVEVGPRRTPGVVGGKAVHHLSKEEKEAAPGWDKLLIDIGAVNREEAEELVALGDRATFAGSFAEFGQNLLMGKALDDRAGCALLIELLRAPLPYDCHFAFTVLEEAGCIGAKTAGYTVAADIAIVVETTTAADIGDTSPDQQICKLGSGPVVTYMDKGTVYDKGLYDLAFAVAAKQNLKCQTKSAIAGGNDARAIQVAGRGARVTAISLPCGYLHSPSLVISKDDLAETVKLLCAMIEEIGKMEETNRAPGIF